MMIWNEKDFDEKEKEIAGKFRSAVRTNSFIDEIQVEIAIMQIIQLKRTVELAKGLNATVDITRQVNSLMLTLKEMGLTKRTQTMTGDQDIMSMINEMMK